jgi:peptidoglycan/LPS O-acetylase OafA/YrhL
VTAPATRERGYMPQLDALRFFAVLGVVVVHNWQPSSHTFIVGWFDWGTLGVRLFFVLSGFLITGILIDGRELAPHDSRRRLVFMRQFYARRFLRIFPVYYAVLFVLLIAGVGQIRQIWPWLFSYGTNVYVWHYLAYPYAVPHFWTLAIEEQFYLLWPFVLLFLPRRWLMPFLLALCALGVGWRLWASFTTHSTTGVLPSPLRQGMWTFSPSVPCWRSSPTPITRGFSRGAWPAWRFRSAWPSTPSCSG